MSAADLAFVAAIVAAGACVQFLTGFGFSLTAVPLLALVIDVRTASMLAAILAMFTSSAQAWLGRSVTHWSAVRRLVAWGIVGMPFGLWLFDSGGDRALRLFLGTSTLLLVALLIRGVDLSNVGGRADAIAGVAAGVLTTSINTNGPPMVFVLQARKLDPPAFRATITTTFVVLGAIGLIGRIAVGGLTSEVGQAMAVSPLSMLLGGFIGFRLRPLIDGARFNRAVQVLLIVAALSAIASAL